MDATQGRCGGLIVSGARWVSALVLRLCGRSRGRGRAGVVSCVGGRWVGACRRSGLGWGRGSSCGSLRRGCSRSCRRLPVRESQVDGRDLKRQLVASTEERLVRCVQFDHLVRPGVSPEELGERHGGLLFQVAVIELGSFGYESLHPEGAVGAEQTVADLRIGQRFQALFASLELLQVKADILLTAFKFLGAEKLNSLLGGLRVIRVRVVHRKLLKR